MDHFKLVSDYRPSGDQPQAIEGLVNGVNLGLREDLYHGLGNRQVEPAYPGAGS